ncbi:hypothetical protein D9757_006628 [Collybiopsis confluens]|uniref:F-box domain-containing protein n=1 Tax=Collybiopsis confluens TaxID=2823264 RepID=A0A8H5HNI9_9AGAR|nr:hypothetical protein D9757_006628 [Collybiopsis confluens]
MDESLSLLRAQLPMQEILYMPVDSPPTPAPSPSPRLTNIMSIFQPPSPTTTNLPVVSPLTLPQNSSLRKQFLAALIEACTPAELLFISTTIAPLLKRDFLCALPPELALHILSFVDDPKTLSRAERVSRWWRKLVSDESLWKGMCRVHGFDDAGEAEEKRRSQRGRRGKGKDRAEAFSSSSLSTGFSFREHFKYSYTIMKNWHTGGHLLRAHKVSATSITTQDSGVVTSLALDEDWVVVGLANCRIHVFSARTGVLSRTLVGHDLGVWAVCLVHKGGYMAGPGPGRASRAAEQGEAGDTKSGRRKRKSKKKKGNASRNEGATTPGLPEAREGNIETLGSNNSNGFPATYVASNYSANANSNSKDSSLYQFVPPSLRIALGLSPENKDERSEENYGDNDDGNAGKEEDSEENDDDDDDAEWDDGGRRGSTSSSRYPGKPSSLSGASEGWGQPGAIVVSGGCDKVVRVWDIRSGYCIYVLRGHTSTIRCIKVLHNRPIAVSGSRDNTLRVWDVQRGRLLRTLAGHTNSVRCLDVCGNKVVSGSYDHTCRLWDVDTGECLHIFQGHMSQIYSVAFDGYRIASGGLDTTVRVWDAETGQCKATLQGHTALVCQLQISPTILATGGSDGRVIMFSLPPPYESYPASSSTGGGGGGGGGRGNFTSFSSAYPATSATFYSSASRRTLQAAGGTGFFATSRIHSHTFASSSSSSSSSSASASSSSSLSSSSPTSMFPLANSSSSYHPLHRIAAHDSSVTALQFDSRFLVTGGNDGRVRLFETQTGNYVRDLSEPSDCVWKIGIGYRVGGDDRDRQRQRQRQRRGGGVERGLEDGVADADDGSQSGSRGVFGEVLAIMCRRQGKTVMEIWSLRGGEGAQDAGGGGGKERGTRERADGDVSDSGEGVVLE